MKDFRRYYQLEEYLLNDVGKNFRNNGKISPLDFYLIVIWKSNRAKSRTRKRIAEKAGTFGKGVRKIVISLSNADSDKNRLEILMRDWGFLLPMATAILSILYPTKFTIYDFRIVESLNSFKKLGNRRFSENLWTEYQRFIKKICAITPNHLTLRDKDRFLWGKSLYNQSVREINKQR